MKHLKRFENFENVPQVGDYVQVKVSKELPDDGPYEKEWEDNREKFINFMNNNLGRIVRVNTSAGSIINNPNQPIKTSSSGQPIMTPVGHPIWNTIDKDDVYTLSITYDNIPSDIVNRFDRMRSKNKNGKRTYINIVRQGMEQIAGFGKTPEEVELKNQSNKYNL